LANITVISPNIVVHNLDPHTGIPFMPHMAAHLAGEIHYHTKYEVDVIDCFGSDSENTRDFGKFLLLGIDEKQVIKKLHPETKVVLLYCRTIEDLFSTELIANEIRKQRPDIKLVYFENIQTVNSFSLAKIIKDILKLPGEIAILGEPEDRIEKLLDCLFQDDYQALRDIKGIIFIDPSSNNFIHTPEVDFNKNLDALAMPLWEKFQLEGYWNIGFSHAPVKKNSRFLPLLTSRGCPYRCTFCVSPSLNPMWRPRSAKHVVDEMEYFYKKMQITDFHVSDLDPTINDKRTQNMAREIITRQLPITWKLAQGTKIETIKSIETIKLMKQAGCTFVSFSPESGSERMLQIMNKRFDVNHSLKLVKFMNKIKLKTQACFIAGVPGENWSDRWQTIKLIMRLTLAGVDEIAITIFTPVPGSALENSLKGYKHYSELTHSPVWREDYKTQLLFRNLGYITFFLFKLAHPLKVTSEINNFFSHQFATKMEMSFFKLFKVFLLKLKSKKTLKRST
jgi:hypothetical protein